MKSREKKIHRSLQLSKSTCNSTCEIFMLLLPLRKGTEQQRVPSFYRAQRLVPNLALTVDLSYGDIYFCAGTRLTRPRKSQCPWLGERMQNNVLPSIFFFIFLTCFLFSHSLSQSPPLPPSPSPPPPPPPHLLLTPLLFFSTSRSFSTDRVSHSRWTVHLEPTRSPVDDNIPVTPFL